MVSNDKKTRADNFSEEDKGLLLSLIADHVVVLECRKTDHKNNSAKYKAWAAISKKFHRLASHPRNFTQMKDLYRRLKLKAKKDVGMWLNACAESGTGTPLPSSQIIQPDDTSFLVYDMIKPYKEELNPEDVEQERLLAEALKARELSESFMKCANDTGMADETNAKFDDENTEVLDEEAESNHEIKEELDFDFVHPHLIEITTEEPSTVMGSAVNSQPQRPFATPAKRPVENHRGSASMFTKAFQRQYRSPNEWDPTAKRRRTLPSLERRSIPPRPSGFVGAFANRRNTWVDASGTYSREVPADRHPDRDEENGTAGMSPYEEGMFQMAQAEHKAKMLVMQTQRRAETAKEEAYKMIWQNAQLQRDLLQLQYENVL